MDKKKENENKAYLYSDGRYTKFRYRDTVLTFIAPYSLERYVKVTKWHHGYIEVLTKYKHDENPIEEYIDLEYVLDNLLMDVDAFLTGIDEVEVKYD